MRFVIFAIFTPALILLATPLTLSATEEHLVTPDRTHADDISYDPGEPVTGYFHAGRSYECRLAQAKITSSNDYIYFSSSISGPSGSITGTGVGGIYPAESVIASATNRQALHRISFIPTETGIHSLTTNFDNNNTSNASVECFETTLLGSFNTFFANTPIVELRNRGNADISATVTAIDFNNTTVRTKTISVPASSRADAVLDNIPSALYGKIFITYLGPQGALSGIVAEYDFAGASITLKRERPITTPTMVP